MNAAVGLVILIPLLLLIWEDQQQPPKPLDQPPIIILREAEGYSFATGKANLSPDFNRLLTDSIIPKLDKLAKEYRCDIIEVIGHTDETPVDGISNLDGVLLPALNGGTFEMSAGSNLDLGMMRAWSVIRFLQADGRLNSTKLYGYSAGQTILPNGEVAVPAKKPENDASRRRIEIRLRRSSFQLSNYCVTPTVITAGC
jgi:flagellar motor protein MotB